MRIGSITFDQKRRGSISSIEANVDQAVERLRRMRASSLDLLCLPEGFLYAGMVFREALSIALDADSATLRMFGDLARDAGMYLAVPFLERSDRDSVYNAVILLGRDGAPLGTYRKRFLWPSDPSLSELEQGVVPGGGGGPFPTEFGPIGIQTCMEVNWQSGWVELRQRGAKLILFPSEQSGGMLLRHRAWDARCVVLSAVSKGGPSQVIDPLGNVVAEWGPDADCPVLDCSLDYELVHLDHNETKLHRLAVLLRGKARFTFYEAERICLVISLDGAIGIYRLLKDNGILLLDEYLEKVADQNDALRSSLAAEVGWSLSLPAADSRPIRSVAVIIPTMGDPGRLIPCLNSLRAQRCAAAVEIILVVNSAGALSVGIDLEGVRLVHEVAVGPAAARNRGVRESSSECIAFIDDDCIASPLWLAMGLRRLQYAGKGHVVAGAITRFGANRNWVSFFDSVNYLQQEHYVKYSNACVTANMIMHRTTFERVGFFDETFREAACEDWEWAGRARSRSVQLVFEASSVVDHPCMGTLHQLKRKAQRLGRGELMLRGKTDPGAAETGLLRQVRRQLRRSRGRKHLLPGERARLYCLDLWAAFWTWDAARRLARSIGSK